MATAAVLITIAMLTGYSWLMIQQDDQPAVWFVAALAGSALLGGYGAARRAPLRVAALAVSATALVALGSLAILSIGMPILAAGILTLMAAVRARGRKPAST